jgi:glycosyltransferase involved in cell wall biosynthesis
LIEPASTTVLPTGHGTGSADSFRILQVIPSDRMGGAEKIALNLHRAYRARGHASYVATARKTTTDPDVLPFDNDALRPAVSRGLLRLADTLTAIEKIKGVKRLQHLLRHPLAQPRRTLRRARGLEDFDFPATRNLLSVRPEKPDLLHLHNLHSPGGFFDLRQLPALSAQIPTVITLHDAWLLAGHCAHSLACDRWRTGCGQCPDLAIYPPIPRDATAANYQRKRRILAQSRLHVITPSRCLMDKVKDSILQPAVASAHVIPNGVDLTIFHPADRARARDTLNLSQDATILLFAANGIRSNPFKDYKLLRAALGRVAANWQGARLLVLALGESGPDEHLAESVTIRHLPFTPDEREVARHYQAADLYLHPARADTFPTTVVEALACGLPVVATAVGGIPEQITESQTGHLTPPGDAAAFADAILALLRSPDRLRHMAASALAAARQRFDLQAQVDAYLTLYKEVLVATPRSQP